MKIPHITPFDHKEWERLVGVDEALARGDVPQAMVRFCAACVLGTGLICAAVFILLPLF